MPSGVVVVISIAAPRSYGVSKEPLKASKREIDLKIACTVCWATSKRGCGRLPRK